MRLNALCSLFLFLFIYVRRWEGWQENQNMSILACWLLPKDFKWPGRAGPEAAIWWGRNPGLPVGEVPWLPLTTPSQDLR